MRGKMQTLLSDPFPHLVHYITLNLNISTSRQIIKNLVGSFGGIRVRIMHAKFQHGVGGE